MRGTKEMEEKKETTEIVIASGEYMEAYAPFPGTKEENEQKVKRGILARLGMKQDEIDKLINSVELSLIMVVRMERLMMVHIHQLN